MSTCSWWLRRDYQCVNAPDIAGGNAANAAAAATVAKQVRIPTLDLQLNLTTSISLFYETAMRRKTLFVKSRVPRLPELIEAWVTVIRPLQVGDFGFVFTANGVMLGHGQFRVFRRHSFKNYIVIAMYSKTGGKNGRHSAITESSSIAAVFESYLAVQLFQYRLARQFRSVPNATANFQTKQFLLLSSLQFLCLIDTKISPE